MPRPFESDKSREVTDTKLRIERDRANEELLERVNALGETADDVIRRAREFARHVLGLARQREDRLLATSHATADERDEIARARRKADDALDAEYVDADATTSKEESWRRRAIAHLLALEREETDRMLSSERIIADRLVAVRDDLLAVVSHDLRSHLNAAMMISSVVALKHAQDGGLVENMQAIQYIFTQMDKLLTDLLDVVSLESGIRVDPAPVDLASVVTEELAVHRLAAEARSIDLALEVRGRPIMVEIDPTRIGRVVMNVLTNALKFTPEGGRIEIHVERNGNEACISVKDSGPGIPAEHLESVFERFSRANTHARGYGLGLYIARAIVKAHRGRIWAESTPGEGTTFKILVPVIEDGGGAAARV